VEQVLPGCGGGGFGGMGESQASKNDMICFPYYLLCFLFKKIREEGGTGSAWMWGRRVWGMGEVVQTMYTHASKCKNGKIKGGKTKYTYSNLLMEPQHKRYKLQHKNIK
jgi:hypothetical protein